MDKPVYKVRVTLKGEPWFAPVKAISLLGDYWAVGYVTPTGRHRKLKIKGNALACTSEADAIVRLTKIAQDRGWEPWPENREEKCYPD